MQNLWDACLRRLEQELPAQQFNTWIRPLAPESGASEDALILTAPNRFVLELVRAAAIQVAENPGISYNPLFVYGGVGLGKTHLVQAIGNQLAARRPQARIRYIHAEQYVTDVVRAYQQKSFDEFKRYYHSLDLLLIDDIQFFSNKGRTQEEFFYAFNALVEAHKQIVITCDTYPKEIAGMEERLISRFGWGLTVAIEPPELERSEEHTSELQSRFDLVCRLLLEKKKQLLSFSLPFSSLLT